MELHTQCICVCVELKCYSGASRSNRGGDELGVNLYYTFIFMICIHLYLPFSSVCVCVYVCACICGMRESNRGQTVCGASVYNLGGNSGFFWIMTTMPMLRLDPEVPHTVCSWLLSLFPPMHAHTHTHKKKEATGEYRS